MPKRVLAQRIFVFSIIFLTSGAILFWLYYYPHIRWKTHETLNITVIPTSEEIASWKIYTNPLWGYEIRYPDNFIIDERSSNLQVLKHKTAKSNMLELNVLKEEDSHGQYREVRVDNLQSFFSFVDDYVLSFPGAKNEIKYYSKQLVNLNGYGGVLFTDELYPNSTLLFLYHNKYVFTIFYSAFPGYEHDIAKILSTFRFTQ